MAQFDTALAQFVQVWGEGAVTSALNAYGKMRERQKVYAGKYAEQRKEKAAKKKEQLVFAKEIAAAASDPAKLREVLAAHGVAL